MIRIIRTAASLLVATLFAAVAMVWLQVPHNGTPNPGREFSVTFDGAVGMIDLYLRHDVRGYERLADIDPQLKGIGGRAAAAAATNPQLDAADRVAIIRRLSTQRGQLDSNLTQRIVESTDGTQLALFEGVSPDLDAAIAVARQAESDAELAKTGLADETS